MEHLKSSITLILIVLSTVTNFVSALPFQPDSLPKELQSKITTDINAKSLFATDYGNLSTCSPGAVFYPSSPDDIAALVRFSYMSPKPFTISQWGAGHSAHGQTFVPDGVLIDMSALSRSQVNYRINVTGGPVPYVDAGAEQLWIDVLNATLKYGLTPRAFTGYLRLSVGGTLSNAGLGSQAFKYGPQIANVYELDVITGTGEIVTCSREVRPNLFYAALGGLGQFGVITRARIALEPALQMTRWMRFIYTDVKLFTADQEKLISTGNNLSGFDAVFGLVLLNQVQIQVLQASYFTVSDIEKMAQLGAQNEGPLYLLEVAAHYNNGSATSVDEREKLLREQLRYASGFSYSRDVTYFDFIDQLYGVEVAAIAIGEWFGPHPWLMLLVRGSKILDFASKVYYGILKTTNSTGSLFLYPMNKGKWDDNMSAVTPDEDVFYAATCNWSALSNDTDILEKKNKEILKMCDQFGWGCKEYLPYYRNDPDWQKQFGNKWSTFVSRKSEFDPKELLSPGQRIFTTLSGCVN